jgi:hypothetical protein
MRRTVLPALLFALALPATTYAQAGQSLVIGERLVIQSQVLKEARTLFITTPAGYAAGQDRYPVLYLLDGPTHVLHTLGTTQFLGANEFMPDVIIVGIANTDRTRDFTPTHIGGTERAGSRVYEYPTSGGAPAFLRFLDTELVPLIDSRYRTLPFRVLCGHSLGGLFAMHTLVTQPALFQAYVATSPSLGWDDGLVMKRLEAATRDGKLPKTSLFLSAGNEGQALDEYLSTLEKLFTSQAPLGFRWQVMRMPDEDHGSIVLRSQYHGLRMIFDGWRMTRDAKAPAEWPALNDVTAHYARVSERLGFPVSPPEGLVERVGLRALDRLAFAQAAALFRLNIRNHPNAARSHYVLGQALEGMAMFEDAVLSYEKALEIAVKAGDPQVAFYRRGLEAAREKVK